MGHYLEQNSGLNSGDFFSIYINTYYLELLELFKNAIKFNNNHELNKEKIYKLLLTIYSLK